MSNLPDFDALWNYDHPAESERAFRELLPAAAADAAYELELLTQIARAQGLQRQFAEAHATLDSVEQRLQTVTGRIALVSIRIMLERGRLYNSSGAAAQAKPYFERAWELAQAAGEAGYAVDAAHMLGILEAPELTWNLRAVELAESSPDERARRWRASLYNNIGWTYHDRGEYVQALEMFERALALREERGETPQIRIARWMVARALRSLERYDEALALQQAVASELEQAGEVDPYVDEELGECLLALGRISEAQPYFAKAYSVLSQDDLLMKYEAPRLARLRALANR